MLPLLLFHAAAANGQSFKVTIGLAGLVGAVLILVAASLSRYKVVVDDEGIVSYRLFGATRLPWTSVDDIQSSPRLVVLVSLSRGITVKFFHGEFGATLESFEVLRTEILTRVEQRLVDRWDRTELPATYRYPGLGAGAVGGYVASLGVLLVLPAAFSLGMDDLVAEKIAFFLVGGLVLLPFVARDYRRSRRMLTASDAGLEEVNGHRVFLAWSTIAEVRILEPLGIGFGWVIVRAAEGEIIRIPRSLPRCGEVLHLLRKYSGATETLGHHG